MYGLPSRANNEDLLAVYRKSLSLLAYHKRLPSEPIAAFTLVIQKAFAPFTYSMESF